MPSREIKSLDHLMDGAVVERFNTELKKLWSNIFDIRTSSSGTRSITLQFKFRPSAARDAASMTYEVTTKLCAPEAIQQTVLMHQTDDGTVIVSEQTSQIPGQMDMEGHEAPLPNIVEFPAHDEAK